MKIEMIDFREFMAGTYRKKPARPARPARAYSGFLPTVTPQNLFPVHDIGFVLFLVGAGTITLSALIERGLARDGMVEMAYAVAQFGRFMFPIIGFGSVLWLFFSGLRGL